MREDIQLHHLLEAKLYRLRLLRDLGDPSFKQEDEDGILDEGEALWYRMTEREREILEAERAARLPRNVPFPIRSTDLPARDTDYDAYARRGLPPRMPVGAS